MAANFPDMHGDPLLSRPLAAWEARDWDEVVHLSDLAAAREDQGRSEEERYLLADAARRRTTAAQTPVRSTT
jgi:hypothetical protein